MKKNFLYIAGLALVVSACQSDETLVEEVVSSADDANFTISLSAPEALTATRAAAEGTNSAKGGITNVDMDEYDLRYQLMVYRITDDGKYTLAIKPQKQVVDEYQTVTYSLRLTPNRNYQFIAWADFVKEGETDDLHYKTTVYDSEGNWTITCLDDADEQLNDESRDAYYVSQSLSVTTDYSASLELKRPFAKVRIVATDWGYESLEMPDNISITYYGCERFTNINLLDGTSDSETLGDTSSSETTYTVTIDPDNKDYAEGYDGEDYEITNGTGSKYSYRTLTVDYLMTDVSEQTSIHLDFEAYDGTTYINGYDFLTDIPIKRNYLTTIMGNLLTTATDINVWINEDFEDEYTYPDGEVSTLAELQQALALGVEEITLTADIDTEGDTLKVYETTSTINLNGYTLSVLDLYYYSGDSSEGGSTLTINGGEDEDDDDNTGKIVSSYSGIVLWGTGAGLTLNNVEVESEYLAVCLGMDFMSYDSAEENEYQTLTVNNSTITTKTNGQVGAISIQSKNSTVIVTNSEINAACIGISNAVSNSNPQGVTIKLTDTNITAYWNCIKLYTYEGCELSSLIIDGGTFTTSTYNTIMVSNSNISVSNATIINKSSGSYFYYVSGNCISLVPSITGSQVQTYFTYAMWDTPFAGDIYFYNIIYKLGKSEGYGYKVVYWDYTDEDFTDSDFVEYASIEGNDDGAVETVYNYVE